MNTSQSSNVVQLRPSRPDPLSDLRSELLREFQKPAREEIDPGLLARLAIYVQWFNATQAGRTFLKAVVEPMTLAGEIKSLRANIRNNSMRSRTLEMTAKGIVEAEAWQANGGAVQ